MERVEVKEVVARAVGGQWDEHWGASAQLREELGKEVGNAAR